VHENRRCAGSLASRNHQQNPVPERYSGGARCFRGGVRKADRIASERGRHLYGRSQVVDLGHTFGQSIESRLNRGLSSGPRGEHFGIETTRHGFRFDAVSDLGGRHVNSTLAPGEYDGADTGCRRQPNDDIVSRALSRTRQTVSSIGGWFNDLLCRPRRFRHLWRRRPSMDASSLVRLASYLASRR
jgi:hypothetical protein